MKQKKIIYDKKELLTLIEKRLNSLGILDRIPERDSNKEDEEISKKLGEKIVSPKIVNEVVGDLAFAEILEKTKYDDQSLKGHKKLSDINEVDMSSVAEKIFLQLSTLPKEYLFIFRLPKTKKKIPSTILSNNIELVSIDDSNLKDYDFLNPKTDTLSAIAFDLKHPIRKFVVGDTLLLIKGRGYIGKYGTIKIVSTADPLYIFKVIIGIYTSRGVLKIKDDINYLQTISGYDYRIYETSNNKKVRTIDESFEDIQFIDNLEFDISTFEPSDVDKLLKRTYTEFNYTNSCIKNLLSPIKFAKGKTDKQVIKKQTRIKNGAYWYYEAQKTNQNHIRAINITTGYDSLLNAKGESDTKEYKSLMVSNLISDNALTADGFSKKIRELYVLRNGIIHGETAVSSLEKYTENFEDSSTGLCLSNLLFFKKLLSNRIVFLNKGLQIVINSMVKNKKPKKTDK